PGSTAARARGKTPGIAPQSACRAVRPKKPPQIRALPRPRPRAGRAARATAARAGSPDLRLDVPLAREDHVHQRPVEEIGARHQILVDPALVVRAPFGDLLVEHREEGVVLDAFLDL